MSDRVCAVDGCERPWRARDWCYMHYQRWKRHGDVHATRRRNVCSVAGCSAFCVSRGWCSKHLARWQRHGDPIYRLPGEVVDGKRICCTCRLDKPVSEYPRGRAGRCAPCAVEYRAAPERRAKRREWAGANPDYMREYARMYAAVRRARVAALTVVKFTPQQLAARMAMFGGKCWMCGGVFEHVDHVKPIAKGGPHMLANLRPACGDCNRSKSGRWNGVADALALAA